MIQRDPDLHKTMLQSYKKLLGKITQVLKKQEISSHFSNWELARRFLDRILIFFFLEKLLPDDTPHSDVSLKALFSKHQERRNFKKSFFKDVLLPLWTNKKIPVNHFPGISKLKDFFQALFDRNQILNEIYGISISNEPSYDIEDDIIVQIFDNFFTNRAFILEESLQHANVEMIGPDFLGYLYENSLRGSKRLQAGVFFTPPTEIEFMCRQTLYYYFLSSTKMDKGILNDLIFGELEKPLGDLELIHLRDHLESPHILDPACGAGSFLVGMVALLLEVQEKLERTFEKGFSSFEYAKKIVQKGINGIDIQEWALILAKFRLWLLLINQINTNSTDLIPQISIAFNLFEGDALLDEFPSDNTPFDIIIGNPPYVEKEKITPPRVQNPTLQDLQQYKKEILDRLSSLWNKKLDISGRSDYCIYFFYRALAQLKPEGILCFISTNSWLDSDYGRKFQKFILTNVKILSIINPSQKIFEADINTIISFFIRVSRASDLDGNFIRFTQLKSSFRELLEPASIKEYNLSKKSENSTIWRINTLGQRDLFLSSSLPGSPSPRADREWQDRQYFGLKWGTYYFYAPDLFHKILLRNKDKFIQLGTINGVKVNEGKATGANEFFYPRKEVATEFSIEAKFLKPGLKSLREISSLIPKSNEIPRRIFLCQQSRASLEGTNALEYIKWGESIGVNRTKTLARKKEWWKLPIRVPADLILPCGVGTKYFCLKNDAGALTSNSFTEIRLKDKEYMLPLWIFFNSIIGWFFTELFGKRNLGGGLLKVDPTDYRQIPVIKKRYFEGQELYKDISDKMGKIKLEDARKLQDISQDEPYYPGGARNLLDQLIFKILDFTKEEKRIIYRETGELIKQRHLKARSKS